MGAMCQLQKVGYVSVAEVGGMCCRNERYVSVAAMGERMWLHVYTSDTTSSQLSVYQI